MPSNQNRRYCDECSYAAAHGEPVFADCPNCGVAASDPPVPAERKCNHPGAHTSWCNYGRPTAQGEVRPVPTLEEINDRLQPTLDASPEDERACVWTLDDNEWGDVWETECGGMWQFETGGPKENKMKFCGYCGGKLNEQVPEEKHNEH